MMINFTAKFIKNAYISKKSPNGEHVDTCVSIVELDKKNKHDRKAVYNATTDWDEHGGKYGRRLYNQMDTPYLEVGIEKERYLALTTQNADFKKLNWRDIQGLMVLSTDYYDQNEIVWLETNPNNVNAEKNDKPYEGVGKSLVNYAQQECQKEGIYVVPSSTARDFYRKLGFNDVENSEFYQMKWEA